MFYIFGDDIIKPTHLWHMPLYITSHFKEAYICVIIRDIPIAYIGTF